MTYATDKQIGYINHLAAERGFDSSFDAIDAFGLGLRSASNLTVRDASMLIDWLLAPVKTAEELAAAEAEAAEADARRAAEKAAYDAKIAADRATAAAKAARINDVLIERGLSGLTGQARRDARYAISLELKG